MTYKDRGHYAGKHPEDRKVDEKIAQAVEERASENEISCASAFQIVKDLAVQPDEVGFTIDVSEITIVKCQLGLYGYLPEKKVIKPAESVPPDLEKAIREALVNDRLSCAASWEIAKNHGLSKMAVSSACEALGIKITPCQLGAF
jgi:hypothetical protein